MFVMIFHYCHSFFFVLSISFAHNSVFDSHHCEHIPASLTVLYSSNPVPSPSLSFPPPTNSLTLFVGDVYCLTNLEDLENFAVHYSWNTARLEVNASSSLSL